MQQPRKSGRRGMAVTCIVLLVVILCTASYYVALHSRYKVIGAIDPTTGYRIEYTVSSGYGKTKADELSANLNYTFDPLPPPRAVKWIYTHVLRRPATQTLYRWNVGTIEQATYQEVSLTSFIIDGQGYHDLSSSLPYSIGAKKHLFVSGSPATWTTFIMPNLAAPRARFILLDVKPKGQHNIYGFTGIDDITSPTGVESEMMNIEDSIRVTKVK